MKFKTFIWINTICTKNTNSNLNQHDKIDPKIDFFRDNYSRFENNFTGM